MRNWIIGIVAAAVAIGALWYFLRPRTPLRTVNSILAETARPHVPVALEGLNLTINGKEVLKQDCHVSCGQSLVVELKVPSPESGSFYSMLLVVPRLANAIDSEFELMDFNVDQMLGIGTIGSGQLEVSPAKFSLAPGRYKTRYYLQLRSIQFDSLPQTQYLGEGVVEISEASGSQCTDVPLADGNTVVNWSDVVQR